MLGYRRKETRAGGAGGESESEEQEECSQPLLCWDERERERDEPRKEGRV